MRVYPNGMTPEQAHEHGLYSDVVNEQTRIRIKIAVAAYAYELLHNSLMTDHEYDALSQKVDLSIDTRRPDLDKFFREHFNSSTGMWIHRHPDIARIDYLARQRCVEYD